MLTQEASHNQQGSFLFPWWKRNKKSSPENAKLKN